MGSGSAAGSRSQIILKGETRCLLRQSSPEGGVREHIHQFQQVIAQGASGIDMWRVVSRASPMTSSIE